VQVVLVTLVVWWEAAPGLSVVFLMRLEMSLQMGEKLVLLVRAPPVVQVEVSQVLPPQPVVQAVPVVPGAQVILVAWLETMEQLVLFHILIQPVL
jgi:hypothetical protein